MKTFKPLRRRSAMKINPQAANRARIPRAPAAGELPVAAKFGPPKLPKGIAPTEVIVAMDEHNAGGYEYANMCLTHEAFMGYARLAQLTQKPEFRLLSEKVAQAMVRKWVKFKGNPGRIKELKAKLKKLNVRDLFSEAAKFDGFFGRCQLFVDLGQHDGEELKTPMLMVKEKLQGKLRKFKIIEPMYSYPYNYRADNPLADSYYNPQSWYVMGQEVHSSRLLMFISRPVPDILKPAYNFSGMSMSQLALPYVENFLKTRDSVNRMISTYSMPGIATNMMSVMTGEDGDDVVNRAALYNAQRDNQGLFVIDKESEEMFHYQAALGTLDKLQAQSQEHMSSISSVPLVVLFGISPSGLNATGDAELTVWADYVQDMQQVLFRDNLQMVINIIQLSEWGEIDPTIEIEFPTLMEAKPAEQAQIRKTNAETDSIRQNDGQISAEEVRERISEDEESGYSGLPTMPKELKDAQYDDDESIDGTGKDNPSEADPPKRGE